jgi:hypothetical protein
MNGQRRMAIRYLRADGCTLNEYLLEKLIIVVKNYYFLYHKNRNMTYSII